MSNCSGKVLDITDLTGGEVAGSGNFDELMRAVKSHLAEEYKAGRITGDSYSQAYISALDMALGNANTFTLQYLITNEQAKLIEAQTKNEVLNRELIQSQINRSNKDIQYLDKQLIKADSEIELSKGQVQLQAKQLELVDISIESAQKDLEAKDVAIVNQEAQTGLINQQTRNAIAQETQIDNQNAKLLSEIDVLVQRKKSEMAQTADSIDGSDVAGLIGKQSKLYANQAEGYLRDAEQKAAKILNDTLLTRITTDYDQADATLAGQSDAEVEKVMAKLKQGIGL